ncbi:MAG: polyamine aminopropyltransferase [Pseudomonadota bacterium]
MSESGFVAPSLPSAGAANAVNLNGETDDFSDLSGFGRGALLASIVVVALCGIVYELIIGAVSSYLLGNSVYQFSITIGFFMFAMGAGSFVSQYIRARLIYNFILVEIILAVIGGVCSIALFLTFPFSPATYSTVMMAFILSIGFLVGLEIPILTRILAQSSGTRKSIASVMSLDYVGALIGSVAFPLVLLPSLGLVRASFAIGLANILVALVTLVCLRDHVPRPRRLTVIALGVFVALGVLIGAGARLTGFAQQHLYFDDIIWQKQTPYQSLVVTKAWKKNDLRLYIDGHLQFAQEDEHRYHEALVHPVMSYAGRRENILILGGGDGLAVRELLKYTDIQYIDLVDIDPAITDLARSFAPLVQLNKNAFADARVQVFNQDAFTFIKDPPRAYDRVIIDMPDPHDAALSKLYSVEFYAMIRSTLREGGVVVTQSSSPFFARRTFWSVGETMKAVFPAHEAYQVSIPSFGIWGFHLAGVRNDLESPAPLRVETRYWTQELGANAMVFPADIAQTSSPIVNSIFEPRLYQLYLKDMKKRLAAG